MYLTKLLVSDLDGTLLDGSKRLPEGAKEVFSDLAELDIKTAIVTSRPYRHVKSFAKELCCDYVACNNGAEIYHGDELIFTARLDGNFVRDFSAKLFEAFPDIKACAEYNGKTYANYDMFTAWNELDAERCDLPKFPFENADKIMLSCENSSELVQISSLLVNYTDVRIEQAHKLAIITAAKASKANAFKRIAYFCDAPLSQTVAFGDDIGDMEMIELAGRGYCTDNGHPMVKKHANAVIGSNDVYGVIKAIKKEIL